MSDAIYLNELAKTKLLLSSSGGGGTVSGFSTRVPAVAFASVLGGSGAYTTSGSYYIESSRSYKNVFNHGSGQFSFASRHYLGGGASSAEVYARAFTVNQTTGAITVGSGATVFSGSSNIDTGTYAQGGTYVMTQHTSGSNGNSISAYRVSGNAITGTTTTAPSATYHQPMSNNDTAYYFNGSTMYMYPQVYYTSNGQFTRASFSYNGSSISQSEGPSQPGSNTSTNYSWPVINQFNQSSPTSYAGLRRWQDSSGNQQYDLLNSTGSYSTSATLNSSPYFVTNMTEGKGFQLSNGRQLYYGQDGYIFLNNGGTLSDVTAQAYNLPVDVDNFSRRVYPVATDTWVGLAGNSWGPKEIVKFYINPTTYAITTLGSVPLANFVGANYNMFTSESSHLSFTGSTNQFMVLASWPDYGPIAHVRVFPDPFLVA